MAEVTCDSRSSGPEQHSAAAIRDASDKPFHSQRGLSIGAVDDPLEYQADAIADKIMRMPDPAFIQRKCSHCEDEDRVNRKPLASFIQKKGNDGGGVQASDNATATINSTRGMGSSLNDNTRSFMESRFGADFSDVRIHTGSYATQLSNELSAQAFTVGSDIYFNSGKFSEGTDEGKHLLAHELTHTLQQTKGTIQNSIQRTEFDGAAGTQALDRDRPITAYQGPLLHQPNPAGTIVPNSQSLSQNCAGDTCSINQYITWPYLGLEAPGVNTRANWAEATRFVPAGCTRVNCTGTDTHHTRCRPGELETIVFLYRWPQLVSVGGVTIAGTQSDFHMIGRSGFLGGWHSKMDRRERVIDIRDPWQSLYSAYPHTRSPQVEKVQLCFCCNPNGITLR